MAATGRLTPRRTPTSTWLITRTGFTNTLRSTFLRESRCLLSQTPTTHPWFGSSRPTVSSTGRWTYRVKRQTGVLEVLAAPEAIVVAMEGVLQPLDKDGAAALSGASAETE